MKKRKILVYPAGTEIGLEIARALQFSRHFELVGANSIRDHSDILYSMLIDGLPPVSEKAALIQRIKEIVVEYGIDVVYPAHDEVFEIFSSVQIDGVTVIAPSQEAAQVLRYKSATYKALDGVDFLPATVGKGESQDIEFPLFARPDRGQGSVGVFRIDSREELEACWASNTSYIVTEFLPGAEYTVDCYTDRNGALQYLCARERHRIRNGICVRASECDADEFVPLAEVISARIPVRGAWFFQVKRDRDGVLKLMEVANRVAGTMGYERLKGANLIQATLWEALGADVSLPKLPKADFVYDRALYEGIKFSYKLDCLYVDLDDTLIFDDGTINYELVGYVFGLRINKRTKIVLITRHQRVPDETLASLGLSNQFDEIIHLTGGESKADYIKGDRVAFIDDSFAERRAVSLANPQALCIGPEGQRVLSGFLGADPHAGQ